MPHLDYPIAPRVDQADDHHGVSVADPYRPLEDADAPLTRAWIDAENRLTRSLLDAVAGARPDPLTPGGALGSPSSWRTVAPRDPMVPDAELRAPGPGRAVDGRRTRHRRRRPARSEPAAPRTERPHSWRTAASDSGELLAYAVSDAGSDWRTWKVRRASTGQDLPDRLLVEQVLVGDLDRGRARLLLRTLPRGRPRCGVRGAEPRHGAALPRPGRRPQPATGSCSRIPTSPSGGTSRRSSTMGDGWSSRSGEVPIQRTEFTSATSLRVSTTLTVRPLLDADDARYELIGAADGVLYLLTDLDAPRGRVVAIDAAGDGRLREILPEGSDTVESARLVGSRLAIVALHDAHHRCESSTSTAVTSPRSDFPASAPSPRWRDGRTTRS